MARTRARNTVTAYPPKCKQKITRNSTNLLRKFNRPTSVDVRYAGYTEKIFPATTTITGFNGTSLQGKMGIEETIIDVIGNKGGFNDVSHLRQSWECPLHVITFGTKCNPPYGDGTNVLTEFEIGAATACGLNMDAEPWLGSDEELRLEALSFMNPLKVTPPVDMSLQIGEIIEGFMGLNALVNSLEKLTKEITRLNAWTSPSVRRILGHRTLRQLTYKDWVDLAVSLDLTWTLAIRPFAALSGALEKARKDMNDKFLQLLSGEVTLHGRTTRKATVSSGGSSDYHTWGNTRTYTKIVSTSARVKYHSPYLKGLRWEFEKAYWGTVPNLSTAYELYSLTFVLDMFWNFGSFLNRFLRKPITGIQYSVLWTGWSKKITTRSEGWVDALEGTYGRSIKDDMDPGTLITGTMTKSTYLRQSIPLELEEGVVPTPQLKLPNLGQLATLAELIYLGITGTRRFLEGAPRVLRR